MDKKIDLEALVAKHCYICRDDANDVHCKMADVIDMLQNFGEQLLELAAENAEINSIGTSDDSSGFIHEVNKQSILDTIKQVWV